MKPERNPHKTIEGFDRLFALALTIGKRYRQYFEEDDYRQTAALAAAQIEATHPTAVLVSEACTLIGRVYREEACHYGYVQIRALKGHEENILPPYEFSAFDCTTDKGEFNTLTQRPDLHDRAIMIGEFTRRAAYQLHQLVNLPDGHRNTKADRRLAEIKAAAESDEELAKYFSWILGRAPGEGFTHELYAQEAGINPSRAFSILMQVKDLFAQEATYNASLEATVLKVAHYYQEAHNLYHLAELAGVSRNTAKRALKIAVVRQLVPRYDLPNFKQTYNGGRPRKLTAA